MLSYRLNEFKIGLSLKTVLSLVILVTFGECLLDVKSPKEVFDIGDSLTKRLSDSPSGTKEDIINDLTDYYIYLNTAFRAENESHPIGKEVLQKLKARGGPPFLKKKVKNDLLISKYEMGAVEVDHVSEVLEDIEKLWKNIQKGVLVPPGFENY